MTRKHGFGSLGLVLVLGTTGCFNPTKPLSVANPKGAAGQKIAAAVELIRSQYAEGELTRLCDAAIAATTTKLDAIAAIPATDRTIDNTLLKFESVLADFSDTLTPLTFMGYVSTSEALSAEGAGCEEKQGPFYVSIFTRRDLYNALKDQAGRNDSEKRLVSETLRGFENNGLKLSDEKLAQVKDLKSQLSVLESQFSTNLNKDTSTVEYAVDELPGAPASFLERLKKTDDGKYIVTTKSTDYLQVAENVTNAESRKKAHFAYENRQAEKNTELFEKAVGLRQQIAALMGYATWADYRINGRMAKDGTTALTFLSSLKQKLALRTQADLDKLLAFKREGEPNAASVNAWDLRYLAYQVKKRDYQLDNEKIRDYFPADVVMNGLFDVYSKLLGVTFTPVADAKVWADGVKLYEVSDKKTGERISYFFLDAIPRELKYGHAAAFTLIQGRRLPDGTYSQPISSVVCNFNPPADGKPSLLDHDEVETIFHEFGHIMHQILTRAPFASLAGSSTSQDFVEAPSQMLENWVWSPEILSSLSGHYQDHSKKLPAELLAQMIAAKDFNQGYFYMRQLLFGIFDLTVHTATGPVDVTATYDRLYKEFMGIDPLAGTHFPANFGHMMGGYDAGYYGYIWSEVYAADMFTRFADEGLLSEKVGGDYRRAILEKGNTADAIDLLRDFLGREPSAAAFFKKLGITE